jgi:hypothetical protein
MVRRLAVVLMVASLALLLIPAAGHADGKEQIVFSGEAEGTFGEVGFWIWCAVDEQGAYDDCSGAMHFDDLGLARHVEGDVTEPEEGRYVMDVASTRDDAVACTLTNTPPITSGATNRVDVSCSSPSGSASTSDAVIGGNA